MICISAPSTYRLLQVLLPLILSAIATNAWSEEKNGNQVYKQIDERGNVVFTDRPTSSTASETIIIPETNTMPATQARPVYDMPASEEEKDRRYDKVEITSPQNNYTIQGSDGSLTITAASEPSLDTKHKMVLLMDGKAVKWQTSGNFSLSNINRGSHQFQVAIRNQKGKTLASSDSITVHIHRHSVLHRR